MKINRNSSMQNTKLRGNNRSENYLRRLGLYKLLTMPLLLTIMTIVAGEITLATILTGDEILARVQAQAEFIVDGDRIVIFRTDNLYGDGTTSTKLFAGLLQRVEEQEEESLLLFVKEPEENFGMIHLLLQREGEVRMWLYLPLLGMTTEIIVEEGITGREFAIGVQPLTIEEYRAHLIGAEILQIAEEKRPVYVLSLTARPEAIVDFPSIKMWVDKETFLPLRLENYNAAGELEIQVEILDWGEFEEVFTAKRIISRDLRARSERTITIYELRRPIEPFPAQLFDPEKLALFDPAIFGLIDQQSR